MIAFFTNFMNHHQRTLADNLYELTDGDYKFVTSMPVPNERLSLGYKDANHDRQYILNTYESSEEYTLAKEIEKTADIVIVGSYSDDLLKNRLPLGKLTFHCGERYFKEGISLARLPWNLASAMKHIRKFQKYENYQYLCMSAYAPYDINMFANYRNRMYKWGYFTEVKTYNIKELLQTKKNKKLIQIIWAGRLIDWKHPELAIDIASRLKLEKYEFRLKIIGTGVLENELRQRIELENLEEYIEIMGAMPPEKVRSEMEKSDIFLFTSDFNEGWGAVLNEAMNSACAVVSSHAVGAAPYLIKQGQNGYVYQNGDVDELYKYVETLMNDEQLRSSLGTAAYMTIKNTWNASVAAKRFLLLCDAIKNHRASPFEDGPCSRAEIIREKDMYSRITGQ